jgi:predicted amidohydrolase YtcJ
MSRKILLRLADLIFSGGMVITMEGPIKAVARDVAVADGRILSLRKHGDWADLKGPMTTILDVTGKTLIPGLIDSHNHMIQFGQNLETVEVSPDKVKSIGELIAKVKARATVTPRGEWIKAWGYNEIYLKEKVHPMKEYLDQACPDHPVRVNRACMHVMAVNSIALKLAGISDKTPDPPGGRIGRDKDGRPNGLLYELGAMNLINRLIPNPSAEDCAQSLSTAANVYLREGLTLVSEAGAGWSGNPNEASGFQVAWQSGKSKLRVSMGLMETTYRLFPEDHGVGLFTGFGNDHLWLGPIKFVLDGSISGRTAALSQPYQGSEQSGVLCEDTESLAKRMERAHRAGFQISVHAIGDRAIDTVLGIYETIISRYPRPHRHRIEHAEMCRLDFLPRLNKLRIIPVVQPAFIHYFGDSFIRDLGNDRLPFIFPLKSMLASGTVVAGSSDRPVTEGNPWIGIWSAVNRITVTGNHISPEERITPAEAIKIYTSHGAYANFAEDFVGTLSPGKFADVVVLDENPLEIDPSELRNIHISRTFVNGQEAYNRENDQNFK